jgi:hypothetical protein
VWMYKTMPKRLRLCADSEPKKVPTYPVVICAVIVICLAVLLKFTFISANFGDNDACTPNRVVGSVRAIRGNSGSNQIRQADPVDTTPLKTSQAQLR